MDCPYACGRNTLLQLKHLRVVGAMIRMSSNLSEASIPLRWTHVEPVKDFRDKVSKLGGRKSTTRRREGHRAAACEMVASGSPKRARFPQLRVTQNDAYLWVTSNVDHWRS